MNNFSGQCLCGAVSFTTKAEPLVVRACWCKLCQTLASGNATINLGFPSEALSINGELSDYQSTADSGNKMHRRFCPKCGTHMFSEAEERPNLIIVRAGTLNDSDGLALQSLIWTSEAPSWAHLDPNLQQYPHQPPAPKIPKPD